MAVNTEAMAVSSKTTVKTDLEPELLSSPTGAMANDPEAVAVRLETAVKAFTSLEAVTTPSES